ncbi:MAG: MBL fold metallo-hydrolase [Thermoplasmatales archaeon]|nr:MAG: MBL fold metallo-hydrolase [Thermoplasmatales archaeon]
MKLVPLASDSLGVRSMATYVETKDCKILIDPSAALGPKRYGLPPHQKEEKALFEIKQQIAKIAEKCDILTISHYHYDHYDPDEIFYKNKKVFAKDINENINKSQKQRGLDFKKIVEDSCELIYNDDSKYMIGNTKITFSPPFFHGPENVRLGYVIMTTIKDDKKRIIHASDVQGPITKEAKDYIIEQKPGLLIMDGPPTIFLGWKFSRKDLQAASDNLIEIMEILKCDVILDHHLLRDIKYKEIFSAPYKTGNVKTFAEYLGKKNNTLEAHRKELWS